MILQQYLQTWGWYFDWWPSWRWTGRRHPWRTCAGYSRCWNRNT